MRKSLVALTIAGLLGIGGLAGCSGDEAKVKEQTTVSGPGGETTTTRESKVETSGDNPPPPANP